MCNSCYEVIENRDFAFCPYCGESFFKARQARRAIQSLQDYCDATARCEDCMFNDRTEHPNGVCNIEKILFYK